MIAIIALFGRQCLIMALITLAEYRLIELSLWLLLSYFRLLLPYYGSCRFIRYYGLTLTDYLGYYHVIIGYHHVIIGYYH